MVKYTPPPSLEGFPLKGVGVRRGGAVSRKAPEIKTFSQRKKNNLGKTHGSSSHREEGAHLWCDHVRDGGKQGSRGWRSDCWQAEQNNPCPKAHLCDGKGYVMGDVRLLESY